MIGGQFFIVYSTHHSTSLSATIIVQESSAGPCVSACSAAFTPYRMA
jgi:hypothetical protein